MRQHVAAMSRLSRRYGSLLVALAASLSVAPLVGCQMGPAQSPVVPSTTGNAKLFVSAFEAEMRDPTQAAGYLDAIRYASQNPGDADAIAVTDRKSVV